MSPTAKHTSFSSLKRGVNFIAILASILIQSELSAQWSTNGFVIEDPSGPTTPGLTESGNCITSNFSASNTNYVGRAYNNANVDLTQSTSGFSYSFDLNFGTNTSAGVGDGFSFVIMAGKAFGLDGGQLGYTNMSSDYLAFEWDSYANSSGAVLDPSGLPTQHMDINGYNGAAENLATEVSMGSEIRNTGAHNATITWAPDGSGGGTFTQTIMNGTLRSISVTFTAAQLSAYAWATAADFNFHATTNSGVPQTQSACWVNVALPVNAFTLSAAYWSGFVELTWQTEENNSTFTIYRSNDSNKWETIGTVSGTNNSSREYTFSNRESGNNGLVYFKLIASDENGNLQQYPIVAVNLDSEHQAFVSPNPSNGKFNLAFTSSIDLDIVTCTIFDMKGNEFEANQIQVLSDRISIDASNLFSGIYMLRAYDGKEYKVIKFVVQ